MTTIRPLEREDVPAVAGLLGRHLESSFELHEAFLAATLVDHPWADPDTPSLVALDGDGSGEITGFIGALARRMRVDDQPLRAVCCTHLVVDPGSRGGATGALLLKRLVAGPQDFTWSDTANEVVLRMWRMFGGHPDHLRACDWMLIMDPLRWAGGAVRSLRRERTVGRDVIPVGALPLQAGGPRLVRRAFPPVAPGVTGEHAATDAIVAHASSMAPRGSIRADYDAEHLDHLFALVERTVGRVVRRLVRREGRPVGWYAYVEKPAGAGRLLHLAAPDKEVEAVMGEFVNHARDAGRVVLSGRLEPHLEDPLRRRLAVLGLARRPVIHSRDDRVRDLLGRGSALITQLDGEWYVT